MCTFYSCQLALWLFLIQKCWAKQWHQKACWKYGLYVGADDNLYTEFKKSIETSIVQKIRTVKEINVYILFLSICSWTFFIQKCWTKQWHQKARWKYGLYVRSRRQSLHRIQKKLLRHPLFQKFGQLWK